MLACFGRQPGKCSHLQRRCSLKQLRAAKHLFQHPLLQERELLRRPQLSLPVAVPAWCQHSETTTGDNLHAELPHHHQLRHLLSGFTLHSDLGKKEILVYDTSWAGGTGTRWDMELSWCMHTCAHTEKGFWTNLILLIITETKQNFISNWSTITELMIQVKFG